MAFTFITIITLIAIVVLMRLVERHKVDSRLSLFGISKF